MHRELLFFFFSRIFPELSSTDMVVIIVKGMNLPAPSGKHSGHNLFHMKHTVPSPSQINQSIWFCLSWKIRFKDLLKFLKNYVLKKIDLWFFVVFLPSLGIQPNDLDAYIKFDFPYPSAVSALNTYIIILDPWQSFWENICRFFSSRSSRRDTKQT